jgi:chaperonin cofactor prefoldin
MRRILAAFGFALVTAAVGGATAQADSVGNQLSIQRNELRSEYRKVVKDLADVEEEIEQSDGETTVTGTASAVWAVRRTRNDLMQRLRSRRNELKQRESALERDYRQLTRKAEDHYEELPMWWGDLD